MNLVIHIVKKDYKMIFYTAFLVITIHQWTLAFFYKYNQDGVRMSHVSHHCHYRHNSGLHNLLNITLSTSKFSLRETLYTIHICSSKCVRVLI